MTTFRFRTACSVCGKQVLSGIYSMKDSYNGMPILDADWAANLVFECNCGETTSTGALPVMHIPAGIDE